MRKILFAGIELTSQRVRGYMVPLSYRGDLRDNKEEHITTIRSEAERVINRTLPVYHFEAGAFVHENDDVAVPAETRVLHRHAHVDEESLSSHARPFVCLL